MRRNDRQVSNLQAIEAIIQKAQVCHLALCDGDEPYLVTMNFGYESGNPSSIYFHCANEGKKLEVIKKNNKACFQFETGLGLVTADRACGFGYTYKSVVGSGRIEIVTQADQKERGLSSIMQQYAPEGNYTFFDPVMLAKTTVLKLTIFELIAKVKE